MSQNILERIDAAVENLCACGCGTPLADDGPSAWFASETCQSRWQGGSQADPEPIGSLLGSFRIPVNALQRWQIEPVQQALVELGHRLADLAQPFADALEQMQSPALEDPMERALRLRRSRNTGPKVPLRAPRRIDPRRGR